MEIARWRASRTWLTLAVVLLVTLGMAACGDDDDEEAVEGAEDESTVTFTAEETGGRYSFDVPDSVPGGTVEVVLDNSAGKEPHDLQLIKVTEGTSYEDFTEFTEEEGKPFPDFILDSGGGVGLITAGKTATTVQELDEGTYLYFCEVEVGGEEGEAEDDSATEQAAEGEEDEEKTHADLGMAGTIEVEGTSAAAEVPSASGTITSTEYAFEAEGLKAGSQTVTFRNPGKEWHHAVVVPMLPGKTIADVKAAFEAESQGQESQGPPPVDFEKGFNTPVIGPGQDITTTMEFAASGSYALVCFIQDKAGGPPHVAKGMLSEGKVA